MKIKAFTLLELLTGMIASAIVIASIFMAAQIVLKMSKQFSQSAYSSNELSGIQVRLAWDIANSDTCIFYQDKQEFQFICNNTPIIYRCYDSTIVRQQNSEIVAFNLFTKISQDQSAESGKLHIKSARSATTYYLALDNFPNSAPAEAAINAWFTKSHVK